MNGANSLDFEKSYLAPDLCLYVMSKATFSCPHIYTISLLVFPLCSWSANEIFIYF